MLQDDRYGASVSPVYAPDFAGTTKLYCLVAEDIGVNNLPKVTTWQHGSHGSNQCPVSHKPDALATSLSSHQQILTDA